MRTTVRLPFCVWVQQMIEGCFDPGTWQVQLFQRHMEAVEAPGRSLGQHTTVFNLLLLAVIAVGALCILSCFCAADQLGFFRPGDVAGEAVPWCHMGAGEAQGNLMAADSAQKNRYVCFDSGILQVRLLPGLAVERCAQPHIMPPYFPIEVEPVCVAHQRTCRPAVCLSDSVDRRLFPSMCCLFAAGAGHI
jgi:hypothetical protein